MTFQLNFKQDGEVLYGSNLMENLAFVANIGMNFALDGVTVTNQDNLKLDFFTSDTATVLSFMEYDSGSDYYNCLDTSVTPYVYYVDIIATSLTEGDFAINNCQILQLQSDRWRVWCDTGTDAVKRAQVIKTLYYGTNGTDSTVLNSIVGLTALETSDASDIGLYFEYTKWIATVSSGTSSTATQTGAFTNTSTNTLVCHWGAATVSDADNNDNDYSRWEILSGSARVTATGNSAVTALGTDTEASEQSNPASCQLEVHNQVNTNGGTYTVAVLMGMMAGTVNWTEVLGTNWSTSSMTTETYSGVPVLSASTMGTDDLTCYFVTNSTTITTNETVAIVKSLNSITPGNTLTTAVSFNGGSNYTTVTEKELATIANTGTSFLIKFTIVRALNTDTDYVTSYAAYYG